MIDIEKYFKKGELIPAIVQEEGTNEVLMLAYMNRESMKKTLETSKKATKASIFSFSLNAEALALSISAFTHFLYDIMNFYLPREIFSNCLPFRHAF